MKIKTKLEKHAKDNEKRREALKEKAKLKLNQSEIIKRALSTASLYQGSESRIIFRDDENKQSLKRKYDEKRSNKPLLFNDANSEDELIEIKEKSQFKGKKGFELLKLQGSYGNDERFKIDERFVENEDNTDGNDVTKVKSSEILEESLDLPSNLKKTKKRTYEMIRYDASNKDHEKYEIKQDVPVKKKLDAKISVKKKTKKPELSHVEKAPVQVSQEKFYEVSKNIKDCFVDKSNDSQGFSLLQTYSAIGQVSNGCSSSDEEEYKGEEENYKEQMTEESSPSQIQAIDDKNVQFNNEILSETKKTEDKKQHGAVALGIWKESFFFVPNDPRFQESVDFINKKDSEEASAAADNYDATRKKIREIMRLHNKKLMAKKNPFKNKIGGTSKRQLTNSKYKKGSKPFKDSNRKGPSSTKTNSRRRF